MTCKNCKTDIAENSQFCTYCGAKVITHKITVKRMLTDVSENIFGWDNKFFLTVRTLITAPHIILGEYLDGTRKKYTNPITFFAIGMDITIFIFNTYDEDYLRMALESVEAQNEWLAENIGGPYKSIEVQKQSLEFNENFQKFFLKYLNIISLMFLPIYGFIAYLVYRKPYHFAEHLTIVTYIHGISFYVSSLLFLIAINTSPYLYSLSLLFLIFFYCYAYGKLYKLSIGQSIIKLILFLGVLFITLVVLTIIGMILVIAYTLLFKK